MLYDEILKNLEVAIDAVERGDIGYAASRSIAPSDLSPLSDARCRADHESPTSSALCIASC
jgi:hypothetical protein